MKMTGEKKKRSTFCLDCCANPETCGKNPVECMKEASLYFEKYNETDGYCRLQVRRRA